MLQRFVEQIFRGDFWVICVLDKLPEFSTRAGGVTCPDLPSDTSDTGKCQHRSGQNSSNVIARVGS